jgi:DnaK suppressor protein
MAIDLNARRAQLQKREKELTQDLNLSEAEALEVAPAEEARDATDDAVADEERDAQWSEGTREYHELVEVQDALARIDAGTYGKCEVCGKEISAARLDAMPATRYCIEHARKMEPKVKPATL